LGVTFCKNKQNKWQHFDCFSNLLVSMCCELWLKRNSVWNWSVLSRTTKKYFFFLIFFAKLSIIHFKIGLKDWKTSNYLTKRFDGYFVHLFENKINLKSKFCEVSTGHTSNANIINYPGMLGRCSKNIYFLANVNSNALLLIGAVPLPIVSINIV
jgi:hypothetical protein